MSVPSLSEQERWMWLALQWARRGSYGAHPNPMVGAVVVRDGKVVGRGYHGLYGGPHAEIYALREAGELARGSDLYVTLEPCNHYGQTPPCSKAVIESGIKRVFIGAMDPGEGTSAGGAEAIRQAGIEVTSGVLKDPCEGLIRAFIRRVRDKKPWVTVKTASTLDGKVATYTGSSRWITGPESRQYVHDKRARVDGIITGIGTVLADDPMLDIRLLDRKDARAPHRIVLDPQARLPIGNRLAVSARRQPVTVIVSDQIPEEKTLPLESLEVNILRLPLVEGFYGWPAVLQWCAQLPMNEVLIEAGPKLVGSAFDARVIDSVICFLAPKLAGGQNSPSVIGGQGVETIDKTPRLVQRTISFRGKDVLIEGDLEYPSCAGNNSASGRFDEPGY